MGVMDGSVKIKGVNDGREIAVLDGWIVGDPVGGASVTVAEGLGGSVGSGVSEGERDGTGIPTLTEVGVGVAGAAQAARKSASAR